MPDEAHEWHTSYLYRRAVGGLTHEQYLDEPGEAIEWLIRIHALYEERDRRREAEQRRAAGG